MTLNISRHCRGLKTVLSAATAWALSSAAALALEPVNWQVGYQAASSPIAERTQAFSNSLVILVTLITVFVLVLLVLVIVKFNAKANPVPTKTSHNTMIEVVWTVVPVLILVGVAIPSFALLFAANDPARAIPGYDPAKNKPLTVKAIGHQWSWSYEYPDNGGIAIDSGIVRDPDKDFAPGGKPRLLEADYAMVVPIDTVIRLHVTTTDVIHSFTVPAFSVKMDAIPGRLNETWFLANKEGIYYGQCAQLCGQDHAFMPINVRVVSKEKYAQWAAAAKTNLDGAYKILGAIDAAAPTALAAR